MVQTGERIGAYRQLMAVRQSPRLFEVDCPGGGDHDGGVVQ